MNYHLTPLVGLVASFLYFPSINASKIVDSSPDNQSESILLSQTITGERQVTIEIEVNQSKSTGESWDIDRSVVDIAPQSGNAIKSLYEKPDIAICIENEQNQFSSMICLKDKVNPKITASCEDSYSCTFDNISIPSHKSQLVIVDLDVLEHDIIGKGYCELNSECQLGQAQIKLTESIVSVQTPESIPEKPNSISLRVDNNLCNINQSQLIELENLKNKIQNLIIQKTAKESRLAELNKPRNQQSEIIKIQSKIDRSHEKIQQLHKERELVLDEIDKFSDLKITRQRIIEAKNKNKKLQLEFARLIKKGIEIAVENRIDDELNKIAVENRINDELNNDDRILKKINKWIKKLSVKTSPAGVALDIKDLIYIQKRGEEIAQKIRDNNSYIDLYINEIPDRNYDELIDSKEKYFAYLGTRIDYLDDRIESEKANLEREKGKNNAIISSTINVSEEVENIRQQIAAIERDIQNRQQTVAELELAINNKFCPLDTQMLDRQPDNAIWDSNTNQPVREPLWSEPETVHEKNESSSPGEPLF